MIYVALLRGINLGKKNKINMKKLKVSFENVGLHSVTTYINSGNIIFEHSTYKKDEIVTLLEKAIQEDFSLDIKVLIRNMDEMKTIYEHLPPNWENDKEMQSDVLFLWDAIDKEWILNDIEIKPEIDTVIYTKGALLWQTPKNLLTQSGMPRLATNKLYKKMTVRNVNTVRKIFEIMKSMSK